MSLSLDPVVAKKLTQFRRRRMTMLIVRGLCAGIVAFIVSMAAIACIDWCWLLSDTTRWCLTCGAYVTVIAAVWLTCIRRLLDAPAREEIASQVEQLEPELRENLLSAVELATDDPDAVNDSPVFRSLLQSQVAKQMGALTVPRLLPFNLVARWFMAAALLCILAFSLLTFAGPQIRQLIGRAVLPGANIARVSRIQIEVLQPTPHSLTLATNDTVAVVVDVSGGKFGDVVLETYTATHGTVRQDMRGRDAREFVSNLNIGDEPIDYRIMAGDAITKKYRIESAARPQVVSFHKTFEYPEYTGLEPKQSSETSGDLIELQGTTAQLVLELNQEVVQAELRVSNDDEEIQTIPLVPDGDRRVRASVPIEQAGIYKVHLVSKATGFESTFSPRYEIRPIPDLIPRTGFVGVTEANLILPPNDLMSLRGMAEDDLPLVSLDQMISVNGRTWQRLELETAASEFEGKHRFASEWQWDLLPLKLKAGDQVTTKLVATDRKGNVGESIPLNIVIASADFDPNRHVTLKRKFELYRYLAEFASLGEESKKVALETIKRLGNANDKNIMTQARTTLLDLASRQRDKAYEVLEHLQQIEREMPPGADAFELELIGQLIARIRSEFSTEPVFLFAAMELDNDPRHQKTNLKRVKQSFERTADNSRQIQRGFQVLLTHNMMAALEFDMLALEKQQTVALEHSMNSWERLVRQQTIMIRQMDALEKLIRRHRSGLHDSTKNRLKDLADWSRRHRENLQAASESEDTFSQLKNAAQTVLRELADRKKLMDGGMSGEIVNVWNDLRNRTGSLFGPLDRIANAVADEHQLAEKIGKADDSAKIKTLTTDLKLKSAQVDLLHRSDIEQLRYRRILNQSQMDGDPRYAADAGLAYRAEIAMLAQRMVQNNSSDSSTPESSPAHEALREISRAYRTLEAGHELVQTRNWVKHLSSQELWKSQKNQSAFDNPRQWDLIIRGLEYSVKRLRQAGIPNEIASKLDQVRRSPPVRTANQKITERRWRRDRKLGAGSEMLEIKTDLNVVLKELEPTMAEARAILEKYAPTIPEMAEKAAGQLLELEEKTLTAADELDPQQANEKDKTRNGVAQLQQQQNAINQQIDDLFDALAEQANAKDLMNEEQREQARDADDSIAMIEQPAAEMNKAMEEAERSKTETEQAEQLANAAEQQEKTAQALMKVAEHFTKMNEGQVNSQSRGELRDAEKEMGLARKLDEQFEQAKKLSEMAEKSNEDLLAELEEELEQNPAMQEALSEITKNTLDEAENELKASAEMDKNLQRENERSDSELARSKQAMVKELRAIGREANELANLHVSQAQHFAERGMTKEGREQLDQTKQKLQELSNKTNTTGDQSLLKDLTEAVKESSESLAEASKSLDEAKKQTAEAKDKKIHKNEQQRKNEKRVAEDNLRQVKAQQDRNAQQLVRQKQNVKRQADQQVRREENDVKREQQNVEKAQKNLNKNPDQQHLKNQVAQAEQRKANEEKQLERAKERQKNADEEVRETEQLAKAAKNQKTPQLNDANPAAQLADNYTGEAQKKVDELKKRMETLKEQIEKAPTATPAKAQLANAERKQAEIQDNVGQVAKDVAQAARHEERLKNEAAAKEIEAIAKEIEKVAKNEVKDAKDQLAQAEDAAKPKNAGEQSEGAKEKAQQAHSALAKSEAGLNQQAEKLAAATAEASESVEANQTAESKPSAELEPSAESKPPGGSSQSAESKPTGESKPSAQSAAAEGSTPSGTGEPESGQGEPQLAKGSQPAGQPSSKSTGQPAGQNGRQTPAEIAQAQQLAQTLDALDRQMGDAPSTGQPASAQSGQPLSQLADAAQTAQAQMAAARAQAKQQASESLKPGNQSEEAALFGADAGRFEVTNVERSGGEEWGKLRKQSAEEVSKGRSESVSEAYRKSVETYFRVLAERGREEK